MDFLWKNAKKKTKGVRLRDSWTFSVFARLVTVGGHRHHHSKMADFEYFLVLSVFSWKKIVINSKKCIGYGVSDSQIDRPQRGRPQSPELLDAQSGVNTESCCDISHLTKTLQNT